MKFDYRKIVAKVDCSGEKGSAFLISPTLLLTAYHVVKSASDSSVVLTFPFFSDEPFDENAVIKDFNEELDIAILELNSPLDLPFSVKLANQKLVSGINFNTYGYPISMLSTGVSLKGAICNDQMEIVNFPYEFTVSLSTPFGADKKGLSGSPIIIGDSICGFLRKKIIAADSYLGVNSFHQISDFLQSNNIGIASKLNFLDLENFKNVEKLNELSRISISSIQNDINGETIKREKYSTQYNEFIDQASLLFIVGTAGVGKSAVLRQIAESQFSNSTNLICLTSDKITEYRSWADYISNQGLSITSHQEFFCDLVSLGDLVLFIDGIDRLLSSRGVLQDIFNHLNASATHWKLVVTLRDSNAKEVSDWLAPIFDNKFQQIVVKAFDDSETQPLIQKFPFLQHLSNNKNTKELVRRPFFAKILVQQHTYRNDDALIQVKSELDLIQVWWKRAGVIDLDLDIRNIKNALLHLSRVVAQSNNLQFKQSDITNFTVAVNALISAGVIQEIREGRFKFAHDLFFEWSLFWVFELEDLNWVGTLTLVGQPPLLGHVVSLLSEYRAISDFNIWTNNLNYLKNPEQQIRPQWFRTWLVAPLSSLWFDEIETDYYNLLKNNEFSLLKDVLDILETEKIDYLVNIIDDAPKTPNVLASISNIKVISDGKAWKQLLVLILRNRSEMPIKLVPMFIDVFTVWQTSFREYPNIISEQILQLIYEWIVELDLYNSASWQEKQEFKWNTLNTKTIENDLISVFLFSTNAYPNFLNTYLDRLLASPKQLFKKIVIVCKFTSVIVKISPEKLSDVIVTALVDELPKEKFDHWKSDQQRRITEFESLAEPRTEREILVRNLTRGSLLPFDPGSTKKDELSIKGSNCGYQYGFYPISPLQEPFHSFFTNKPDIGLDLTKKLVNHAVLSWQQLIEFENRKAIPIELEFPWGQQIFWGDASHYQWPRGYRVPEPIGCALMAMETWAFKAIEDGGNIDEILQNIIQNNNSISVLSTALSICLEYMHESPIAATLVGCQHLYKLNITQNIENSRPANLIGFNPQRGMYTEHRNAVITLNNRVCRKKVITELIMPCLFSTECTGLREPVALALQSFPQSLPFFIEDEKENEKLSEEKSHEAKLWSSMGDLKNYSYSKNNNTLQIYFNPPSSITPAMQEKQNVANRLHSIVELCLWVQETAEQNRISALFTLEQAIELAKKLDEPEILSEQEDDPDTLEPTKSFINKQALIGVLGTAALTKLYSNNQQSCDWAAQFCQKFYSSAESMPSVWKHINPYSENPLIYFAISLLGDIRVGKPVYLYFEILNYRFDLLLKNNLPVLWGVWSLNSCFVWNCLDLMLRLSAEDNKPSLSKQDQEDYLKEQLDITIANYEAGEFVELFLPPTPWVNKTEQPTDDNDWPVWEREPITWNLDNVSKIIASVPVSVLIGSDQRDRFLCFSEEILAWTIQFYNLPDSNNSLFERHYDSYDVNYNWSNALSVLLIQLADVLPLEDFKSNFLSKIEQSKNTKLSYEILNFFTGQIMGAIMDKERFSDSYLPILDWCADYIFRDSSLENRIDNDGTGIDFDLSSIIKNLNFIIDRPAMGAFRFANGDWSQVNIILPLLHKVVLRLGWIPRAMTWYVKVCDNSKEYYPMIHFVANLSQVIIQYSNKLHGWKGLALLDKISSLMEYHIVALGQTDEITKQQALIILDKLVELGDSRSAMLLNHASLRGVKYK